MSTGLIILFIFLVAGVICIYFVSLYFANKKIDETVDEEINNTLIRLDFSEYNWNNEAIYFSLKHELRACIMDNRKNWPTLAKSYIRKSPTKMREIGKIVKSYLETDRY